MQKQRISKQKIFDAAKVIAHLDKEPTTTNVRYYLAFTGSQTTLHKYLKEWRLKCFQAYRDNYDDTMEQKDISQLQAENQELAAIIGKMEEHNKIVAGEFAKTERKNIELTQKVTQLENQVYLLEKELDELKKAKEHINNLYSELKEEREVVLGKMERDKDQLIASLRKELQETHQANLAKIQDVSYHGHELLMQEKVKSMNLEERVKFLIEDTTRLQQELNSANQIVSPLKTYIKQMEKLITESLTSEQLREYEKKRQEKDFSRN
jgi:chromosome segregation ATPase